MNAFDAESTIPQEFALTPEQERDIESAERLLAAGTSPRLVLRTLYMLARFDGLMAMAKVRR